jgi:hypothetical protein
VPCIFTFSMVCPVGENIGSADRAIEVGFVPLLRSSSHYFCAILIA